MSEFGAASDSLLFSNRAFLLCFTHVSFRLLNMFLQSYCFLRRNTFKRMSVKSPLQSPCFPFQYGFMQYVSKKTFIFLKNKLGKLN